MGPCKMWQRSVSSLNDGRFCAMICEILSARSKDYISALDYQNLVQIILRRYVADLGWFDLNY